MECPRCSYESPFDRVQCPRCESIFAAASLEELSHLRYLSGRLQRWLQSGVLQPDEERQAHLQVAREIEILEEALGIRPAAAPARAATAAPTAASPDGKAAAPAAPIAPSPAKPSVEAPAAVLSPPAGIAKATSEARTAPAPRPRSVESPPPPRPVAPARPARPAPAERVAVPLSRPTRPAFSWADLGTSLLSERTLHALLGLGAFLILASGVVISTLNPTHLAPLWHLAAVVLTTLLFYGAGFVVRQKLKLTMTGAVLLGIGGAFVPLSTWTLGQEQLLRWEPTAVWLAASLVCLPLYLGSHIALRDRTFAVLTALAGGSQLLASAIWLQIPLEWALCAALVLAIVYLSLSKRLAAGWQMLSWALFWTAQLATPLFLFLLMVAKTFPDVYRVSTNRELGDLYEYAVGAAWWLGVWFYARAARLFAQRRYAFAAAWTLPFAYLFTLTKAPWDGHWYGLCLVVLAFGYLAFGRWRQRLLADDARPSLSAILRQPAYQVGLALAVVGALWPSQTAETRAPTLYAVVGLYALAAWQLRHVLFRSAAAYLLPIAILVHLDRLQALRTDWADSAWWNVDLALLAIGYVAFARAGLRLARGEGLLAYRPLAREPLTQTALFLTVAAAFWPDQMLESRIAALYLVTAAYALAGFLFGGQLFRYVVAYLLPLPFGFSLEKLTLLGLPGFDRAWHSVPFVALAAVYLLFGRFALRPGWFSSGNPSPRDLAREPVFQASLLLTLVGLLWPPQTAASATAASLALAGLYSAAAFLLRMRLWAYVGVAFVTLACQLFLNAQELGRADRALAWTILAAALLACAEYAAARTGENRRPLVATVLGRGAWRSRFASPLFLAGYAAGSLAALLGLVEYWLAPAGAGIRHLEVAAIFALLGIAGILVLSAIARRSSFFLYPAVWILLIPISAGARRLLHGFDRTLLEHDQARLLLGVALAYLLVAYRLDRLARPYARPYARPLYLAGYVLTFATMLLSALNREANVHVVGVSLLVYVASVWLVHRGRLDSFQELVARLFHDPTSAAHRHARALFLYLAVLLFPAWLMLAMSLRQPAPEVGQYGLVLALLAPLYAAIGRRARRVRTEYRLPWYLGGYALSAIGPLVATANHDLCTISLAISVLLYAASAVVSRHSAWLYAVALLVPVLLWQWLASLWLFERFYGLGLVALSLAYGLTALALEAGDPRRALRRVRQPIGAYAQPFFVVGYALGALGLARLVNQERELVAIGFFVGALVYAGSAFVFAESAFSYPLAAALAISYVTAMTVTPLEARFYGLGLLPGLAAFLAIAETLRRRIDTPSNTAVRPWLAGLRPDSWSTPFYLAAYLGMLALPWWSTGEQGLWAAAWWSAVTIALLSARLFRHPGWLYPTLLQALIAWEATAYVVRPSLLDTEAHAMLAIPTWLLFWGAYAVTRLVVTPGRQAIATEEQEQEQEPAGESTPAWRRAATGYVQRIWSRHPAWIADEALAPRGLEHRWAAPLLIAGWATIVFVSLATYLNPGAGLLAVGANALLLAIFTLLWCGQLEVWASLALAILAHAHALKYWTVPMLDRPPRWALLALALSLLAIALKRRPLSRLTAWPRPLEITALVVGAGAVLFAFVLDAGHVAEGAEQAKQALQPLAATVAVTGLTVVGQGFDRRRRILSYLGITLVEVGYMLQLVFLEVGQPQAFVLPAGLYLLGVAYFEWRRGTAHDVKRPLEVAGLALMLVVSALQAVGFLGAGHDRYFYATLLLLQSAALFGLGALLHWRATFFAGALALVLDVAILLADPIRSMNTWYLVAVIGFVMIGTVLFVERQRQRIPFWLDQWRQRLETWD